jgi:hypothetical protein
MFRHEEMNSSFQLLVERYIERGMSLDKQMAPRVLNSKGSIRLKKESATIWRDRLCMRHAAAGRLCGAR